MHGELPRQLWAKTSDRNRRYLVIGLVVIVIAAALYYVFGGSPAPTGTMPTGWILRNDNAAAGLVATAALQPRVNGQGNDVVVHVDPGAPGAWLSEPFYTALKGLSENQGPLGGMVSARIGGRCIVFKPDGHIDLGALGDDETIRFSFCHGQVEATKIRRADAG